MATKVNRVSPNVEFQRAEYIALLPRWELIRDCIAGEAQIKNKGDMYLPRPNPTDVSAENEARYEQYKQRAVFYNVTGRTLQGLNGLVFKQDPKLDVPELMELLMKDIDGAGVTLDQQAGRAVSNVLAYGRCGLLVDYPITSAPATKKDLADAKIRPTISFVEAWDVINWRTTVVGGKQVLSLVVISERYVTDDDGFEMELDDQWRVLRLDEQGLYVQEEWIRDPDNKDEYILKPIDGGVAQFMPTNANGARLNYIPFTFIGAVNNDPQPDLPPMFDLASINVAHYRNSADYEEACYFGGQPTPVLAGLTEDWVKTVLKGQVRLGSRAAIPLPVGGTAELLQAEANGMPFEAMEHKEKQMVAIGAKLVSPENTQRTATEARMDNASECSVLFKTSENVSSAYVLALRWMLNFLNSGFQDAELVYELNKDFELVALDAQSIAQVIAAYQGQAITFGEMRKKLRDSNIATIKDDEEAREIIESEQVLMPPTPAAAPGAPVEKE
jgi:hypothetical protein